MNRSPETDPVLRMIDAVLGDLSVRTGMYVGRRSQAGDAKTFVIQTGEEGRWRLGRPDLTSDASVQSVAASAQAHVSRALGEPVPLCPQHHHALVPTALLGELRWVCPDGDWQCGLGDYEELTWPQLDADSLAPILMRRLHRRDITGVVTVGVTRSSQPPVAEVGVLEETPDLVQALRDAAAPLPVVIHREKPRMRRVGTLSQSSSLGSGRCSAMGRRPGCGSGQRA